MVVNPWHRLLLQVHDFGNDLGKALSTLKSSRTQFCRNRRPTKIALFTHIAIDRRSLTPEDNRPDRDGAERVLSDSCDGRLPFHDLKLDDRRLQHLT